MIQRPIGFSPVEAVFHTALQCKKLHHAWLLHGLSGVGKAMLAKTFAADCLCLKPNVQGQACGLCHACLMLGENAHPDYLYISRLWDEKKKRFKRDITISQVRELLVFLSLSSLDHGYRVVIVDCLDDLNHQAANALLKGLEEPSSGGVLLLVCHDLHHTMATIRSRCLLQACPPLNQADCAKVLATFSLHGDLLEHAKIWARGRAGGMLALSNIEAGAAAVNLHGTSSQLACSNISHLQEVLQAAIQHLPHMFITRIVFMALHRQLNKAVEFDAMQHILCWPSDVHRHTLRPSPALFSRMMQLRTALKN